MTRTALRRALIFTSIAGLGLTLAWLLAGRGPARKGTGTRLAVVDVPPGTSLQGPRGIPGIVLVEAEGIRIAPIEEIQLDDGTRVPFRALVLRSDAERPLPSTTAGVRRAALVRPHLRMVPKPKTRAELEDGAVPTTLTAPEGVLESGPGDRLRLELRGGVEVEAVHKGTPWSFRAEQAFADLDARAVKAPGPVSVESKEITAEGRDLEVRDEGRVLLLAGGATGTVKDAGGVRFSGGASRGDTRFRCTGPFRIESIAPPPGVPAGTRSDRSLLSLDGDARVEQDGGSIAGDRIRADLRRGKNADEADFQEVRAEGRVVLEGRSESGDLRATGGRLVARPVKGRGTEAFLEEKPAVAVREKRADGPPRLLELSGDGSARVLFPEKEGPVEALFRGGALAVGTLPPKEGDAAALARRIEVRAKTLSLDAVRQDGEKSKVRGVNAVGDASYAEGERRAHAERIFWSPRDDGGSRVELQGAVTGSWPAAGAMDPLSGARGDGVPPPAEPGTMLLSTPGRAVIEVPPEGVDAAPATFLLDGGPGGSSVVRRVAGEREVWRLSCTKCEGSLRGLDRSLETLVASGAVVLAGREERPDGRSYDLRGETLEVRGEPGTGRPLSAELRGAPGAPPSVSFTGPDGRPLSVAAESLRLDRTDGSLHAEGAVRANGVLPEGSGGSLSSGGGRVEFACERLDARFVEGEAAGTSRLVSLAGKGSVRMKTATESASGDTLVHDAERGTVELRGDPARVTARPVPGAKDLEDRCESSSLLLSFKDGSLHEARAPEGGMLVRHRVPADSAKSGDRETQRVEARAAGPIVYRPGETVLTKEVVTEVAVLRDGAFRLRYRMEGADEIRVLHPATGPGSSGRFERAIASSRPGRISVDFREGGWTATGISLVEHDASGNRLIIEAEPGIPRFHIDGKEGAATARRVVCDLRTGTLGEWMGVGAETGK